jgi:hypothetical protein
MTEFRYISDRKEWLMKPPVGWSPFLVTILVASIGLDLIDLVGRAQDPLWVTQFACSIRAFAMVGPPIASLDVLRLTTEQCLMLPCEPMASIVFLAVKLSLALWAILILMALIAISPENLEEMQNALFERFKEPGGFDQVLRKFGSFVFESCGLSVCLLLLASLTASDSASHFVADEKFVIEDFLVVAIPTLTVSLITSGYVIFSFALQSGLRR